MVAKTEKLINKYEREIKKLLSIKVDGEVAYFHHLKSLEKNLKNINHLISYTRALDRIINQNIEIKDYVIQLEFLFKRLLIFYLRKDPMTKAYFTQWIQRFGAQYFRKQIIYKLLLDYMDESTVYLRESILLALYQQPDVKFIVRAFKKISDNQLFHHPKLIADGLATYPHDQDLSKVLWQNIDSFSESICLGVINYISQTSDAFKIEFYEKLKSGKISMEQRLSYMRYFRKHPDLDNIDYFIKCLSARHDVDTSVRVVAAQVLGSYNHPDALDVLTYATKDPNWYVRENASKALLNQTEDHTYIDSIIYGEDVYAKEMMVYLLNKQVKAL